MQFWKIYTLLNGFFVFIVICISSTYFGENLKSTVAVFSVYFH